MSDTNELRESYGLRDSETLPDKWRREHAERLSHLREMTRYQIEDELREFGCDEALITVVTEQLWFRGTTR